MHLMVNEIGSYVSSLKVICDAVSLMLVCCLLSFVYIYFVSVQFSSFAKMRFKTSVFTFAIFSILYDINRHLSEDYFHERSRNIENGCKTSNSIFFKKHFFAHL